MPAAAAASTTMRIPAAASTALTSLLNGPARPAEVIAAFPVALYLGTPEGVVALETPAAVRLPNALTLHPVDHATVVRHAKSSGGRLVVGGGGVRVGPVDLVVGRWWDPVPRLGSRLDASTLAARFADLRSLVPPWPDPDDPAAELLALGRDLLAAAIAGRVSADHAAHRLVGLGAGLTPAGDDLLAGTVAGLVIFESVLDRSATALPAAATRRAARTTPLAADLTRHAARGAVAEPVAELCRALAGGRDIGPAVKRLLEVGHTSGRDLAEGLLLSGRFLAARLRGQVSGGGPRQ